MQTSDLIPATLDVQCQDVWWLDTIRPTAMLAYKRLEKQGTINIQYPLRLDKDRLVISYTAQVSHEWTLLALKKAEQTICSELVQEQQRLEHDLLTVSGPDFQKTQEDAICHLTKQQNKTPVS